MNIVIYSKEYCPYCRMTKQLLNSKGVDYELIDIEGNAELRQRMIERSGRKTVPQIFIGDQHIGGFDDLNEMERKGQLGTLLANNAKTAGFSA
ncbi:MAG: glutaredoxin 3 [Gammaproteobacteria bacterium]|jgi:glutaredoxin 3|nr:glutaredoxin 3 [Gammaproteobacteria bacterium]